MKRGPKFDTMEQYHKYATRYGMPEPKETVRMNESINAPELAPAEAAEYLKVAAAKEAAEPEYLGVGEIAAMNIGRLGKTATPVPHMGAGRRGRSGTPNY